MNNDWKNFLLSKQAVIENDIVTGFNHSMSEEQSAFEKLVLADLSHYTLIKASGGDVVDFFQGQFTNDIKQVTDNSSQLSAYCSPKGRMLASFRIFKRNEDYYLSMHSSIVEATLKRLRMFVMRSDVTLEEQNENFCYIGIAGKEAVTRLSSLFGQLPANTDDCVTENSLTITRLHGEMPRFEIFGPIAEISQLWQSLEDESVCIGENSWKLLSIRAGIPEIVSETVEAFVPQMVNLQAINSLSFTKGCYPGQEVVARMQYLGKLKRRLYIATVETENLPLAGQIIVADDGSEQKAGQVVNASWSNDNQAELLAVLIIEKAENHELHIENIDGPVINLTPLPYSLEKK